MNSYYTACGIWSVAGFAVGWVAHGIARSRRRKGC